MASKKPKFEVALKKLEEIVQKMEEGNLSLEQSMKLFEEGIELSRFCEKTLSEAQGAVEKMMSDETGKRVKVPFEVEE